MSGAGLSRRGLLMGAAAASGLAVGGMAALSWLPPRPRAARVPLRALTPESFSILAAVADRICPGGRGLPSAWGLQVPESMDALLDRKHPGDTDELVLALWLIENPVAGALLDQRAGRFSYVDAAEQDRVLARWRTSALPDRRKAFRALSGLISATYWAHPDTHAYLGYPGPPRFPT